MSKLLRAFERLTQAQTSTQFHHKKRFKVTTSQASNLKPNTCPSVKSPFPIWQVTMPLGVVLIFAIGSLSAYFMVEGRYLFDLHMSREQIRIRTDVDKRKIYLAEEEEALSGEGTKSARISRGHSQTKKVSK